MALTKRTPRGKFVYKKVNKVRWRPSTTASGHIYGSHFLSGSWDDTDNSVSLWSWCPGSNRGGDNSSENVLEEPDLVANFDHAAMGDVNDIQFLNPDFAVVASSSGVVTLLRLNRDLAADTLTSGWTLQQISKWDNLHGGGFSCNGLSCFGENVASVGDDGCVNVVSANSSLPIRTYPEADSCILTSVLFTKADELIVGNMRGQLKIWDLRTSEGPASTCVLSSEQVGITTLTKHPTQSHVICTGSEDGMLAFWDLRKEKHPVTLLAAHSGPVSEVQFHHQQPENVFSCSQNGEVLHWNGANINNKPTASIFGQSGNTAPPVSTLSTNLACPWLNSEAVKNRVEVENLMMKQPLPLNSLDTIGNSIVFGGDNEAVYVIPDILF